LPEFVLAICLGNLYSVGDQTNGVVVSPGLAGEPLAAPIALRGFSQWRGKLFAGRQGIVDEHDE